MIFSNAPSGKCVLGRGSGNEFVLEQFFYARELFDRDYAVRQGPLARFKEWWAGRERGPAG